MNIVNCSKCGLEMEIDTVNGERYITEADSSIHHVYDCTAAPPEGE